MCEIRGAMTIPRLNRLQAVEQLYTVGNAPSSDRIEARSCLIAAAGLRIGSVIAYGDVPECNCADRMSVATVSVK